MNRKKPRFEVTCPCGKKRLFLESEIRRRNPKYCSLSCRNKYHTNPNAEWKYPISEEMKEEIKELYQNKVGMEACSKGNDPVKALAKKLNLPRWKITRTAQKLGLISTCKKEPYWTKKEDTILQKHAYKCPEVIQKHLKNAGYNRTVNGIVLRRKRQRLLQNLEGQSALGLAKCFGVDGSTVCNWIKKGYLRANKRGTKRTAIQGGDMYYIKDKWVKNFIVENVNIIDFRKVDKYWLVGILTERFN